MLSPTKVDPTAFLWFVELTENYPESVIAFDKMKIRD